MQLTMQLYSSAYHMQRHLLVKIDSKDRKIQEHGMKSMMPIQDRQVVLKSAMIPAQISVKTAYISIYLPQKKPSKKAKQKNYPF